jgi:hypothetical protein
MIGQIEILKSSLNDMKESLKDDFIFFSKIDRENTQFVELSINCVWYNVYFEATYTIETGHDQSMDSDFEYVEIDEFKILGISKIVNDKELELRSINSNLYIKLSNMAQNIHENSGDFPEVWEVVDSKINEPNLND